ncbi:MULTISPECIES: (2Fe-2S)-binding protein [unclassified Leisingera]|uniref:(2Fe-2S)-binding protein n=1 Tax=unclassified Leisingera TaxID=2614906 RepID=UPI000309A21D|nr:MULTISPECIES: (2Fe-2S)-binding protein [unclassified Leisingera]KIC22960.1 sarcosine oxidase [Leisingera sp. ANG-S3]KIC52460.1 sarcosine oxidase [Leisingera sp. ANG-S]KID07477.1 sarcosine oxidase [Leisingera sp. ANG1]
MFRSLRSDGAPKVTLTINGQEVTAAAGQSVWSAMALTGQSVTRRAALSGENRSAYCAMGVCFECMVIIDGLPNQQACLHRVAEGMTVTTQNITQDCEAENAGP